MKNVLTLNPIHYINGNVQLPGSKSISNRVLLLSAVSCGITYVTNLLDSDDVQYMLYALKAIGIKYVLSDNNTTCKIYGNNQFLNMKHKNISLFLGNAGTALRPLVAMLSLGNNNNILLTGDKRMKERPIHDLIDTLRQGSAKIIYCEKKFYLPIKIKGGFLGGKLTIKGNISSQFLSALLMSAPLAPLNTEIMIDGKLVSQPYVNLTLKLIKLFGVNITHDSYRIFYISGKQEYKSPGNYFIEGDASSASYFLAAAAIKGGTVCVTGLNSQSIQGDIYFANILEKMGAIITWGNNFISCTRNVLKSVDLDMNDIPDSAMTIAILALFSSGVTTIRNIYNWRVKESDRLSAMSTELRKIGAIINEGKDFISICPPKKFNNTVIETYNDHRIAMCFSLISLSGTSVTIIDPRCTSKTFPNYFSVLSSISIN
ncbi:3-phosphoshikimate 1-carboxyvinyltransferase [Buchnera aphidicola (Formosaphis micheliae)]|uniref:3-phosphoshikimate 1-carboxyvinyltransferase n=1 Tax=Buchnera aphidicola TaxID=9 RepID=UPI0031B84F89